jgi:hypothetical protein
MPSPISPRVDLGQLLGGADQQPADDTPPIDESRR